MNKNKQTLLIALLILAGGATYPLLHYKAATPEINAINSGANTNIALTVQIIPTNKKTCENSTFSLSSSLAYTTITNQTPTRVNSSNSSPSSLPNKYTFSYTVPTKTITQYGYSYKIGFSISQTKKGKTQTIYTQPYYNISKNNSQQIIAKVTCK